MVTEETTQKLSFITVNETLAKLEDKRLLYDSDHNKWETRCLGVFNITKRSVGKCLN